MRALALGMLLFGAPAAVPPAKPTITRVHVQKSAHAMELVAGDTVVERFVVAIGPGGAGSKRREGDKTTPVGRYRIAWRMPSRAFHVFLALDYPNAEDTRRFVRLKASGELPPQATIGGAIGIHGGNLEGWTEKTVRDWTLGCIAVTDAEIERVAALVPDGTPVDVED